MKAKNPRGYLLIEVAIGGVMAGVIIASLLQNIGDANDRTTIAGRRETAAMLAEQAIEQARAEGLGLSVGSNVTIAVPAGLNGTYTRTRTVTSGTETLTSASGNLTVNYREVTVTVTFPNASGAKTVTMTSRIYG
jgi:type II secretory pathway pseudopilin PulG